MMRRREFITFLGSAAMAWPLAARAQPAGMRRVGVLMGGVETDPVQRERVAALKSGLETLGWSEGRTVHFDVRFFAAGTADFAKEIVGLRPDVMFGSGTGPASALQRESGTIPIVFVNVSDPVGSGFLTNLARPDRNLTGFLLFEAGIDAKMLSMLKEFAPSLRRAAFLGNPKTTAYDYHLEGAKAVAPSLGLELMPVRVETADDIQGAIEAFARTPNGGLVFPPDTTISSRRNLIVGLAARFQLPAVYGDGEDVTSGGLMGYDTDRTDIARRAASYIDRLLRGAKPADLPVQAPVKYRTLINLSAAKVLGAVFPPALLVAADEVIE
jgi:putative ABC transport system substrate-binding protein